MVENPSSDRRLEERLASILSSPGLNPATRPVIDQFYAEDFPKLRTAA
jgi:hypothetical protein